MRKIRQLLWRVRRLLQWLPVIWRTRDFDYHCCLEIFSHSLGELERHLLEHNIHVGAEKDAKRIRYVRNMIKRHEDETATTMIYGIHDKRWGEAIPVFIPIPNTVFSEWRTVRLHADTPEEQEKEIKEYRIMMKKAQRLEERDWNEIWDTIKKYGQHWWC